MGESVWRVDHDAHLLHVDGRVFPCDRDIEAALPWRDCILLLSSDTDCLSLWDRAGLIRTARAGVYPQDMAVQGDIVWVCGGADGRLHGLHLPDLQETGEILLPGMPERIALHGAEAYILTLLAEPEIQTVLLHLTLPAGRIAEMERFPGLPGDAAAAEDGLWIGAGERVLHLPWGQHQPDVAVEGFSLAGRITVAEGGIIVQDALEERRRFIRT